MSRCTPVPISPTAQWHIHFCWIRYGLNIQHNKRVDLHAKDNNNHNNDDDDGDDDDYDDDNNNIIIIIIKRNIPPSQSDIGGTPFAYF